MDRQVFTILCSIKSLLVPFFCNRFFVDLVCYWNVHQGFPSGLNAMISGPDGSTANLGFVETLFFVDVPGCFALATAATPMAIITEKCLSHISLVEGVSRISTKPKSL
jgi:hypothetical protein